MTPIVTAMTPIGDPLAILAGMNQRYSSDSNAPPWAAGTGAALLANAQIKAQSTTPQGDLASDQQSSLAGGDREQPVNAYMREMDRARPIFKDKLNNFMEAIAGPAPDENTRDQAHMMLTDTLGVDPEMVAREYVKYNQASPIHRQITNLAIHHAVNANADSYINNVLNKRMPFWENIVRPQDSTMSRSPESESIAAYQRAVLSGLRNLLQDKNAAGGIMKHLMDFRTLEQPIPFVQSKVRYQ
jgi:hypothetical protein